MDRVRRIVIASGTPTSGISFQRTPPEGVWATTLEHAHHAGTLCRLLEHALADRSKAAHHAEVRRLGRELGCEL